MGFSDLNLENAVGSRKSAQPIDSSVCRITSYMKKVLITNKVATDFFITLSKSIARLVAPTFGAHLFRALLRFLG